MVRSTAKEGSKHPQRPNIGPFLGPPAGSAPSALLGGAPGPPYSPLLNWGGGDFAPVESGPPKHGPPGGRPGGPPRGAAPEGQYCP
jgi:translation initiation factor IF-2